MPGAPDVELLWWRGCPSSEQAVVIVREEMQRAGLNPASLRIRELTSDAEAAVEDFPGSPTIRVDGSDIEDPAGLPRGLTCRVYRLRDGRISPLPDRERLREALIGARGG